MNKKEKNDKPVYSNVNMTNDDFVAQGFRKLDDNLIERRPPKIKWGEKYRRSSDKDKIQYLEKLAATMNQAAFLIQGERNELAKLCELKEEQIVKLKNAMDANTNMLQIEITKINEERQSFNKAAAEKNTKIRELEKQLEDLSIID